MAEGAAPVGARGEHRRSASTEVFADILRERIYGGLACLSTLLVLLNHLDQDARVWPAFVDVLVTAGGLWAASLFADIVADLAAHGHLAPVDLRHALRASIQIIQAAAVPLLLLAAAGLGWWTLPTALRVGIGLSVATLGLFALLAARRTGLVWWKQALLVAVLVVLGVVITAVKIAAHG